jgi:hypothetical protein
VEVGGAVGVVVTGDADGEGGVAVFYSGEDFVPEMSGRGGLAGRPLWDCAGFEVYEYMCRYMYIHMLR